MFGLRHTQWSSCLNHQPKDGITWAAGLCSKAFYSTSARSVKDQTWLLWDGAAGWGGWGLSWDVESPEAQELQGSGRTTWRESACDSQVWTLRWLCVSWSWSSWIFSWIWGPRVRCWQLSYSCGWCEDKLHCSAEMSPMNPLRAKHSRGPDIHFSESILIDILYFFSLLLTNDLLHAPRFGAEIRQAETNAMKLV